MFNVFKGLRKYAFKPKSIPANCINVDPVIFQITTRNIADAKTSLLSVIKSIHESCRQAMLDNYEVVVVADSDEGANILNDIGQPIELIVPSTYKVDGAIKKARALQYANELRREQGKNTANFWVFHLDEESHVDVQTIEAIKVFISQGKHLIGTGPIVGWNNGETIAEDQLFGLKVYEKYGQVFGWHGGIIYEQPPLRVKDMLNQRKRWFIGVLTNLKHFSYVIGLYWNTKNIKVSRLTKVWWLFQQLLFLPIVALLETSAAVMATRDLSKVKSNGYPHPNNYS